MNNNVLNCPYINPFGGICDETNLPCEPENCDFLKRKRIKIYNATPHPINIINNAVYRADIRKYVVPEEIQPNIVATIPSDGILSAIIETTEKEPINGIPVYCKSINGCDPLPEGYDIYIVSALYASAARACNRNTSKLYTIAEPVYSPDGKTILGSRGICLAF